MTTLPHDAVLPQLAFALDTAAMGPELARRMSPSHHARGRYLLRRCEIERVQYKPRKNCLVSYRLTLREQETDEDCEQSLCARIFEAGGSMSRFQKATRETLFEPNFGPPLIHIEPLDMVVWAFPNERKLHGLSVLTNPSRLRDEVLGEVVRAAWGAEWRLDTFAHGIAHYVPEHTCSVRVALTIENRDTGETRPAVLFGKTYYDDQGAATWQTMQQLWQTQAVQSGRLGIPRPVKYQPENHLLWQEGLDGRTLAACAANGAPDASLLAKAAAAVAALHGTAIDCARQTRIHDLVMRLDELKALIGTAVPSCGEALAAVVDRLIDGARALDTHTIATLHGDLHPQNVFVTASGVALIDLDSLAKGPPLHDIGSWIAGVLYRSLLTGERNRSVAPLLDPFVRAYRDLVPWPVRCAELDWYTAAALIYERAFRCLTRLKPGRLEILGDLIALSDEISCGKSVWSGT